MDIREKIAQLRKVTITNGATEAEALAALAVAGRLMEQHQISEEDLRNVDLKVDFVALEVDKENKHVDPAIKLCGKAVADFCEVQMWIEGGGERTVIFGMKADTEMAEYLLFMLAKSMSRGWREYLLTDEAKVAKARKVSTHKLYWAYRHGFAAKVCESIRGMIASRDVQMDDRVRRGGTDLIVRKQDTVAEALKMLMPHLKITPGRRSKVNLAGASAAYVSGQKDGARVNLNRPLEGKGAQKKIAKAG